MLGGSKANTGEQTGERLESLNVETRMVKKSQTPPPSAQPTHHGLGQGTCSVGLGPRLMLGDGHQNRVVVFTMGRDRFIRCTAHMKQWVT